MLAAIKRAPEKTTGDLAERLSMERTTLVRNIALLERKGLVSSSNSAAGRGKSYRLTGKGEDFLEQAMPLWRRAQGDVMAHLGDDDFFRTINVLKRLSQL
ncbi:MarR family winged helix-turn-helix transcriptional regulator [Roseibium salinum]|uniref:MarR family winged helix-turn-helix transcriptional regulator n=1 Tax=Roseibium salinum TaxID=1604349 RepID=UPI003623A75E